MRRARIWTLVGLIAVVPLWIGGAAALREIGRPGGPDVPVFEVRRENFEHRVYAEGNLEAAKATKLSAPPEARRGMTIAWLAPDGSRVAEGDVVIRFDPTDMEKKLDEGKSDRATTDSQIAQKKVREDAAIRNLERDAAMAALEVSHTSEFQDKDTVIFSRAQIIESEIDGELATRKQKHADDVRQIREDLAQVELDLLAIERRKAELNIQEAESDLQRLEVRAPHGGIFVLKEMWGNLPAVGSTVWGGQPVAEIPKLDTMEARVYVLEVDAGGLAAGIEADVTLDAHPGRTFKATVHKVDALAMPRNRKVPVQYFGVQLDLGTTEQEIMKPGQRVQAVLRVQELADVLTVPRQAIFDRDGKSVAYVRRGSGFEPVEVKPGAAALGRVVVTEGLRAGDRVALRDPTRPAADPDSDDDKGGGSGRSGPGSRAAS